MVSFGKNSALSLGLSLGLGRVFTFGKSNCFRLPPSLLAKLVTFFDFCGEIQGFPRIWPCLYTGNRGFPLIWPCLYVGNRGFPRIWPCLYVRQVKLLPVATKPIGQTLTFFDFCGEIQGFPRIWPCLYTGNRGFPLIWPCLYVGNRGFPRIWPCLYVRQVKLLPVATKPIGQTRDFLRFLW